MLLAACLMVGRVADGVAQTRDERLLDEQRQNGYWGDMGDGTFRNPVIASDFSDPDPVRVGDDYFMVTSTFETSPGVTVLHSKDLVNWTIAGSVFSNLTEVSPAFSSREMKRYNEGVYAPSIRYHDGMFYVYVNLFTDGMFVGRTSNPFGEWEVCPLLDKNGRPLLLSGWTDPCPLWDDDGKAYLTSSNPMKNWYGYLFEMSSDGLRLLDADVEHMKIRDIVYQYPRGGTLYSPNHSTEGNKLYKRNGYYYIVHIEFLDGGNGAGTYIYRSRNIYGTKPDGSPGRPGDMGEYEMRRIDAYSVPYRQELPGQGGFVDTPDGRWYWIAQFNRYGSDGRTPCLLPVSWVDDWPVIGTDVEGGYGKMAWRLPKPITSLAIALPHGSDDFSSTVLDGRWAWNHQSDTTRWSLTERPGYLRLHAASTANGKDDFFRAANTIEQRYMSSDSVVITVKMDIGGTSEGQRAGLVHFNGGVSYATCGLMHATDGKYVVYEQNGKLTRGMRLDFTVTTIYIRSISGFQPRDDARQYTTEAQHFLYSTDGTSFFPFGDEYQMETANFRGDMIGIYTYNNQRDDGYVDVDKFSYEVKNRPSVVLCND